MPFNGDATIEQINTSMNSMLLLNSSCQAVIEAEIQQVDSSWYDILDQELGEAENLVVDWRRSGVLYFQQDILDEIIACGQKFLSSQASINTLFEQLEKNFSEAEKSQLISELQSLEPPIIQMTSQITAYLSKLKVFEMAMEKPHGEMETTIAKVQAAEQQIQNEINSINTQISLLNAQIQTDRDAIAKAKNTRTGGIVETIFGVLLAPVTGGASLILAGIGVASIAEAEGMISTMQSQIANYQQTISSDQSTLNSDEKIVATLNGLTLSTGLVISDLNNINSALDSLRAGWTILDGELKNEIQDICNAEGAKDTVVAQAWFDSACIEWSLIESHTTSISNRAITTTNITVG